MTVVEAGRLGAKAWKKKFSAKRRSELARNAVLARWAKVRALDDAARAGAA